ncbi:hypothetical protein LOAG_05752 [Loa loa]|uniref:G protein-coupled receptor n=1 Tax=Loa loa TaxID=7209 RepID=A0A1I7VXK0_LOALO|nr:hypothetical protein LOAG_05752 [Loa loa]EFO22736.2 hypothetical protein LOAG_05752 [Loa loa]
MFYASWDRFALYQMEIIGHYSYAASEMFIFMRVYYIQRPPVHYYACCLSALISTALDLSTVEFLLCLRYLSVYRKIFLSSCETACYISFR